MYLAVTDRSTAAAATGNTTLSGEVFATLINLSGRRRFTSQRVVLYTVLAANKHPEASRIATEALDLFRDAHTTLIKGNQDLPGVFGAPLQEAYFGVAQGNAKILAFIALAERVLFAIDSGWQRQVTALLEELVECSSSLLTVLNSLTALYETEARNHAHNVEHHLHGAMEEIKVISKQAQVVAMNARIVAARAGVVGKEFAVVATELISITTDIGTILQRAMVKPA
jgi:hypothetical protein